mmetsp:Transcript_67475/g.163112  ORF Transcript_67475/g.163112 Transcript_67475/m.163112 type:complete len:206 (+) Transcript_67475:129-746(+)
MVRVGVIVCGCGWDSGWDSRCEWEGGCGWVQVGGWGGSGVGATPVEGCYAPPIEAAKKSQAALRRVSDRAQLREAADELGLDALAIEGRAERRHVRLHLGEQHAHLVVRADRQQRLYDVVGEGVVQQGAEVGGELQLGGDEADDFAISAGEALLDDVGGELLQRELRDHAVQRLDDAQREGDLLEVEHILHDVVAEGVAHELARV